MPGRVLAYVAMLNAMLHVIVEEGLADQEFIKDRTSGYEALAENVKKFSPEAMAPSRSRRGRSHSPPKIGKVLPAARWR